MVDRIQVLHNTGKIAEAIERKGLSAVQQVDRKLGRGAHEVARTAVRIMPKFRSRTATATGVEQGGPLEWRVRFATRHARYTDAGSGPGGRPSMAEMMDWIRLKKIQPRKPGMSARTLARAIRHSIAVKGTKAQPFAQPALNRMRPRLAQLMREGVREALAR